MKQLLGGIVIGATVTALSGAGLLVAPAAPADAAGGVPAAERGTCSRDEEARNKGIIAAIKPRTPAFYDLMAPDYVQHAAEYARFAELNGVSSKDAVPLLEKYGFGKTGRRLSPPAPAPGQPRDSLTYKVIAECDYIVAVGQHWHPDPELPGKFYATYFFNMWRMKDGKMAEHWDPDDLPSPLPEHLRVPVKDMKSLKPVALSAP